MTEDSLHNAGQGLWLACVEQLSQDLPETQFDIWIKPLTAAVSEDFATVTVFAPNPFKLDWIRSKYAGRITALLEALCGHSVTLELAVSPREPVVRTYVRTPTPPAAPVTTPTFAASPVAPAATVVSAVPAAAAEPAPVFSLAAEPGADV